MVVMLGWRACARDSHLCSGAGSGIGNGTRCPLRRLLLLLLLLLLLRLLRLLRLLLL